MSYHTDKFIAARVDEILEHVKAVVDGSYRLLRDMVFDSIEKWRDVDVDSGYDEGVKDTETQLERRGFDSHGRE